MNWSLSAANFWLAAESGDCGIEPGNRVMNRNSVPQKIGEENEGMGSFRALLAATE
jgi:hypothetical protein